MTKIDFVEKLLQILTIENDFISWNQEGTEFEIVNKDLFAQNVLPDYFRHGKFDSFIRQLNMYGFHKVNRRKGVHIFKHDEFKRDDPNALQSIKKSKKRKREGKNFNGVRVQLEKETDRLRERAPNIAELLKKLTEFNMESKFNHRLLKVKLDQLVKETSTKKSRIIKPIVSEIREKIKELQRIQESLNDMHWQKEQTPKKENRTQSLIQQFRPLRVMSTPLLSTYDRNHPHTISPPKIIEQRAYEPLSMNNLRSQNSISNFLN